MRVLAVVMTSIAFVLVLLPLIFSFQDHDLPHRSREMAQDALSRILAAERATSETTHRFVSFGPNDAERLAALGALDLGHAADLFNFDTLIDQTGRLHVRAVSRADAVRAGRVAPVLESADLAPINASPNANP